MCYKQLAENKSSSVEKHYMTGLPDYVERYPLKSQKRHEHLTKLLHQATEQRNMFQGGITPHQQRTTAASYHIANILAKAMAPLQHGELVKDCLVQSGEMLFPERVDVLRTVEQVPLCQHMHKACGRHCRSLGKYYSEKFKKMGGFLSCI